MKRNLIVVLSIGFIPFACASSKTVQRGDTAHPAPAPAPAPATQPGRDTPDGTIELLIGVLAAKDYRAVFEQFANPEDLEKHLRGKETLSDLVEEFAKSEKPEVLRKLLLAIRGSKPVLDADGTTATYQADPSLGPHGGSITFRRSKGRWYLCN